VIDRAAKVHTERPELPGCDFLRALLTSGELSDEILITLALSGKKSLEVHFPYPAWRFFFQIFKKINQL